MGVRKLLNHQGLTSTLYIVDWLSNKQYICKTLMRQMHQAYF